MRKILALLLLLAAGSGLCAGTVTTTRGSAPAVVGPANITGGVISGAAISGAAISGGTISGIASVPHTRIAYRDLEFYDDFNRANTAAGVIGTSTSGHTYDLRQASLNPGTIGRITNGKFVVSAAEISSIGAYYAITPQLRGSKTRRFGGVVSWTAGTTSANRGAQVFIVSPSGGANLTVNMLHMIVTPASCTIGLYTASGSVSTIIKTITQPVELSLNTSYNFDFQVDGSRVTGNCGGQTFTAVDSRFDQYNGAYAASESFGVGTVNELPVLEAFYAQSHTPYATASPVFAPSGLVVGTNAAGTGDKVEYVDTFDAPFSGTTVDLRNWSNDGAVTQNGGAVIAGDSVNYKGLTSLQSYRRNSTFEFTFTWTPTSTASYGCAGLASAAGYLCGNLHHAFNFFNGSIKVTENNVDRLTAASFTGGTRYDLKIKVYATGARYYLSTDSGATWPLVYDGTGNAITTSPLQLRLTGYVGTHTYDNVTVSNGVDVLRPGQVTPGSQRVEGKINSAAFTFSNIATVLTTNGDMQYCSDCTIANPCAGSGTGAFAKRLNGVNVCN